MKKIILVDENDSEIGCGEKLAVHKKALLHRAFSVFIFREKEGKRELLIQQRQFDKYHCGGLWSNTCCGHPLCEEALISAAIRRLKEEMGFQADLKDIGAFHYIAEFDNGLTENEIDHVCVGYYKDQTIKANPQEISDFRWVEIETLKKDLRLKSEKYTPWFGKAWSLVNN